MSSINPFDYGDYHYNYTPQKLAEESKFNSFMQQNNATYFEATDEVFNNENLSGEELEWRTYHNLKESPTPNVHIISGYGGNSNVFEVKPVDLGLSVLWADKPIMNENGECLFFQWGDTIGYTFKDFSYLRLDSNKIYNKWFDSSTWKWTKYNTKDRKLILDKEDDAASAVLGKPWRMPTYNEVNELVKNTKTIALNHGLFVICKTNKDFENCINVSNLGYFQNTGSIDGASYISKNVDIVSSQRLSVNNEYNVYWYESNWKRMDGRSRNIFSTILAVQDK